MERIKNLNEVILRPDALLAEIVEIKAKHNLILPGAEESKDSLDFMRVVAVGAKVEDISTGDYILDMTPTDIGMYIVDGVKYGLVYRNNIRVAVKEDNFEEKQEKDSNDNNLSV